MSGEDGFIARHFAPFAGPGGLGLRDDAALLALPGDHELVLTVDAVVAGVHFLADDPPEDVARKALRVNLSDLAAKGAIPVGFLLTLALPASFAEGDVARFAAALQADSLAYACPLLGGDTVRTPGPLTVSITAFGTVRVGAMVRRDGAQDGDVLLVSGTIGDAALGLLVAKGDGRMAAIPGEHAAFLLGRYRCPQPRVGLAAALRDHASAAMDVSDGFAGDLTKMLGLAGLTTTVSVADVPLSAAGAAAVAGDGTAWEDVLAGGDDYEILCAVPPAQAPSFEAAAREAGITVRRIGTARRGEGAVVVTKENGRALQLGRLSYSHL